MRFARIASVAANPTPCAEDPAVVDPDPREREGLAAGLRNVAEVMAEMGWNTRLCDLTEAQARTIVEVAVGGFFEVMRNVNQSGAPF
jgi:hypothetical protein